MIHPRCAREWRSNAFKLDNESTLRDATTTSTTTMMTMTTMTTRMTCGKASGGGARASRATTAAATKARVGHHHQHARVTSFKTSSRTRGAAIAARAASGNDDADGENTPFGYTRKDVMLLGGGLTGGGFASYYGLQAFAGMDAVKAGNAVQLTFVLGLTLVWVASYVLRVFNKDMTYVKQLKDYEDAVMQKRLEEMPEAELNKMMGELEDDER